MNGKALDARLIDWLRQRIAVACDVRESFELARTFGYADDAIAAGIEAARPLSSVLDSGPMKLPPLIRQAPPNLAHVGTPDFGLYTLEGFLKPKECARLMALIRHHLTPSTVSFDPDNREFRVSQTAQLAEMRSPVAAAIDEKICRTLGIRVEFSEGIQAQSYEPGGFFRPHFDFFGAESDEHRSACSVRGNRTWTFMVYLNDDFEGGATRFTAIDRVVRPCAGMAVLWNNLNPDGSPNRFSRHCGEDVRRGHKVIITKWFRVRGDGPVFHE
jgi:prolyl 4-hydroxylase